MVPFVTLAACMRVLYLPVCVCVCVCVCPRTCVHESQDRELLMLPSLPVRVSVPEHNMDKQLWDSSLHINDEAEQPINFKHSKWGFPIMAKVRTGVCTCMHVCVCARAYVSSISNK